MPGGLVRISLLVALVAALLAPTPLAAGAGRPKRDDYEALASCAGSRPFAPARRCGYDRRDYFRATFVFKSNVGRRVVKACFRVFGRPPVGGGRACYRLGAISYRAYPFKVTGVREPFAVRVTWYAKPPGEGFKRAAASFLRVHT